MKETYLLASNSTNYESYNVKMPKLLALTFILLSGM